MSTPSPFEAWHKRICQVIGDMAAKNMQGSAGRRDLLNWSAELMSTAADMTKKAREDDMSEVITVMAAINNQVKQGVRQGTVPCPRCGGNVRFTYVSPRQGGAKCQTEGCTVRFMS